MNLSNLAKLIVDVGKGKSFDLHKLRTIGRGAFAKVYERKENNKFYVYAEVKDGTDYSKNIMSEVYSDQKSKYLPAIEYLGTYKDRNIFRMPKYKMPLRQSDSEKAWTTYRKLSEARDMAWYGTHKGKLSPGQSVYIGYDVANKTIELARKSKVDFGILRVLERIRDTMANYGAEYTFEFAPRNLGTDASGNLILVDIVFSLLEIHKKHGIR